MGTKKIELQGSLRSNKDYVLKELLKYTEKGVELNLCVELGDGSAVSFILTKRFVYEISSRYSGQLVSFAFINLERTDAHCQTERILEETISKLYKMTTDKLDFYFHLKRAIEWEKRKLLLD